MTGYTVHTGSSLKFSDNWDKIFSKRTKKTVGAKSGAKTARAKKKSSRKSADR
jgi:hypothetical protein